MTFTAHEKVTIKPNCERCRQPYLHGSDTMCCTCLRREQDPEGRHNRLTLRCDCGEKAVAVILVKILVGELINWEPLAVCVECLRIEEETMREYI